MRILLGATAAFMLMAAPAFAQTALPSQCAFTAVPAMLDGANASNTAMREARDAVEAWRNTRAAELAACNAAVQALQQQAAAAVSAHNAAAAETDTVVRRFAAEIEEYNGRAGGSSNRRGSGAATRQNR